MDENEYFASLLQSLRKPQGGKRLLQVLVALRKQVNAPDYKTRIQAIKDNNCIKPLVGYIRYDGNPKVVDLSLSILGNCCMNQMVIRQTINELNILHNLLNVLEKHKKDSIRGRVFRILGNLCDGYEPLKIIEKEPAVINNVLAFLKAFSNETEEPQQEEDGFDSSETTIGTVRLALRFIRKILVRDTFNTLLTDHGVIKIIGLVLIKCSNDWLGNEKQQMLINDILKIVQIVSSPIYSHHDVITELKSTDNGDALKSLADIILLHPDKIITIIMKLAVQAKHQSDLPIESIIANLLNAVKINAKHPKMIHREYLESVSKLMDHIGFHNRLKSSDNIGLLVELLNVFDANDDFSVHCCIYITCILKKCRFNRTLVKSQLAADVVLIIIDKLEKISGRTANKILVEEHHTKVHHERKRFKRNDAEEEKIAGYDVNKSVDRCASPSSCSDISSSGPFSPVTSRNMCNESDSDNYSPLCSENECDDESKESAIPEDDLNLSESEEHRPILNADQLQLRYKLREEMNSLLKIYCTMKPLHPHLGNPKLITVLTNIVLNGSTNDEKCHTAFSVILSIAQTREFLIPLMMSGFISQVYEITDTEHGSFCADCENLRSKAKEVISKFLSVAMSGSIKGDIAHLLLGKSKKDVKDKLALSIPYVIRDNSVLNKLMTDCGALSILIKLLTDRTDIQAQEKSLKAICTMATASLKIKNPVDKKMRLKPRVHNSVKRVKVASYQVSNECANIVTFNLDDGSCVEADRDALNQQSDYFSSLLSGRFVESEQNEITLKNVSKDALNCLLQLMHLKVKLTAVLDFDYDLETVLDVISLSDRFLLTELNYVLICHVEQLISTSTVPKFYKWAIESGTNIMRIESVAFALVSDVSYKERLNMFRTLLDLGYFYELVDDIEKLIIQFL